MCIRRETREKARQSLAFSRVSKPHTHITYMLRQCTSIVYFYLPIFQLPFIYQLRLEEYREHPNKFNASRYCFLSTMFEVFSSV